MRVHIFKFDNNRDIVFCPDNLNIFVMSKASARAAELLSNGNSPQQVSNQIPALSIELCERLADRLTRGSVIEASNASTSGALSRLVLHVSNDCNMCCRYCYAACGSYGLHRTMMRPETMYRALDVLYEIYPTIDILQLFGGEPTYNLEVIEKASAYLKKANKLTQVGIVTNGTCASKKFVSLIQEYNLAVTVSIDAYGVMDELRPMRASKLSSKDIVRRNIHHLLDTTGQPSQFELTYTIRHVHNNLSIVKILRELYKEYGNIPVHVTPVCTQNTSYKLTSAEPFVQAVSDVYASDFIEMGAHPYALAADYAHMLKNHIVSRRICSAGKGTLAVSADGDIYPCFYFVGNNPLCITNVFDDIVDIRTKLSQSRVYYDCLAHQRSEQCDVCFANTLCHGCMGANYELTGDMTQAERNQCDITRGIIEQLISVLAHKVVA